MLTTVIGARNDSGDSQAYHKSNVIGPGKAIVRTLPSGQSAYIRGDLSFWCLEFALTILGRGLRGMECLASLNSSTRMFFSRRGAIVPYKQCILS